MTNVCPTDFAIEKHLLDPAASPLAPHLAACERCRARVVRMQEEGERFRRFVFPATIDTIEEAARRRPARWWVSIVAPVAAVAAAAAVVIVVRPFGPAGDYVGLKGDAVGLTAFVQRDGAAAPVADGGAVAPTAALRLRVRTSEACRLFVLSVDARGSVSRLDGGGADGLALAPGQHDLAGGVELDGVVGPERLFAVCAPPGTAWREVEQAARAAAAGGGERVRGATSLGALPARAAQATLLLEKKAP